MRISDWGSDVCSSDLKGPERWLRVDRQLGRDEHQAWRLGRQNSWQDGSRLCHRSRGSNDNIGFYQAQRGNPQTAGFDLPRYDPSRPTCLCAQKLWRRIRRWRSLPCTYRTFYGRLYVSCRNRSEEHTSELQSLMSISYSVFCLKKK